MTTGSRTLLVLGAQGFLGRHIVSQWLAANPGHRVVALGRSRRSATHFTETVMLHGRMQRMRLPDELTTAPEDAARITYVVGDAGRSDVIDKLVDRHHVDAVVHAAAALRDDPLPLLLSTNVLSVFHLTRALETRRPGIRLVLVSSGSVNALPPPDGEEANPYSVTKAAGEQVAAAADRVDTVVARVHNLLGAGLQPRHLPARIALELAGRCIALERDSTNSDGLVALRTGPLDAARDHVDVADAARAVLALVEVSMARLPVKGSPLAVPVVDIGGGHSRPMREVVELQLAAAGLGGRVNIEEVRRPGGGPVNLVADPAMMHQLDVAARIPLEESLRAMAAYSLNQLRATGECESRSTSGVKAATRAATA